MAVARPAVRGVALLGFGTVARAVARRLVEERERFSRDFGAVPELRVVASRAIEAKDTSFLPSGVVRTDDLAAAVARPDVEIVVELLGGIEPARSLLLDAFARGKSAVTANKKLLATHGEELAGAAARSGAGLGIEASVAGGIPVLRALREGFAGDRIAALRGILNGTCNFVLTEMERTGRAYADVLREAQKLGYAEADPASDVEGEDAAYKLALLARLAFGAAVPVSAVKRRGISGLLPCDFVYARMLGRTPRQLAVARVSPGGVAASVRTHLVSKDHLLAKIAGPFNAVEVSLAAGGDFVLTGRGAGGDPTATAVVSDLLELARSGARALVPPFGTATAAPHSAPAAGDGEALPFALRFVVRDRPGIIADIAGVLARHEINIDAVLQSPGEAKDALPFVVTLEPVEEEKLDAALQEMGALPFHVVPPAPFPLTP